MSGFWAAGAAGTSPAAASTLCASPAGMPAVFGTVTVAVPPPAGVAVISTFDPSGTCVPAAGLVEVTLSEGFWDGSAIGVKPAAAIALCAAPAACPITFGTVTVAVPPAGPAPGDDGCWTIA